MSRIRPPERLVFKTRDLCKVVAKVGGFQGSAWILGESFGVLPIGRQHSRGIQQQLCVALLYARLGEYDRAIRSLELVFSQRQLAMTEMAVEPAFDPLQSGARFLGMLRQVGVKRQ